MSFKEKYKERLKCILLTDFWNLGKITKKKTTTTITLTQNSHIYLT